MISTSAGKLLSWVATSLAASGGRLTSSGLPLPGLGDIYKPPIEIVSAEIKTNPGELVVAFGRRARTSFSATRVILLYPRQEEFRIWGVSKICAKYLESDSFSSARLIRLTRDFSFGFVRSDASLNPSTSTRIFELFHGGIV